MTAERHFYRVFLMAGDEKQTTFSGKKWDKTKTLRDMKPLLEELHLAFGLSQTSTNEQRRVGVKEFIATRNGNDHYLRTIQFMPAQVPVECEELLQIWINVEMDSIEEE